jgi:hypothetical protein
LEANTQFVYKSTVEQSGPISTNYHARLWKHARDGSHARGASRERIRDWGAWEILGGGIFAMTPSDGWIHFTHLGAAAGKNKAMDR